MGFNKQQMGLSHELWKLDNNKKTGQKKSKTTLRALTHNGQLN